MTESLKKKILTLAEQDLAAIEKALVENLTPHLPLVKEVAGHILFAGGKRLRPLLMVLCARLCGYKGSYDTTFSTIFEYLHAATLLHDDIIDGANMRRGQPVAHKKWDGATVILTGDFLLARGSSIAAATNNPQVIQVVAQITEEMSQGEIHQLHRKGALDLSEAEYMDIIRRKTAVLFQGACRISALLANASETKENALADYGLHLGLAFQMTDDLLDYTQDSAAIGKEVGADLKEGKLTLPVIYAFSKANKQDRIQMEKIINNPNFSKTDFNILIGYLETYGGIAYTRQQARIHTTKAKLSLNKFAESDTRQILTYLADYAFTRKA
jgi:octaprenyl-diphosphate synthase